MYKRTLFIYRTRILLMASVIVLISLSTIGCSDESNSGIFSSQNNFQRDIDQMLSKVFKSHEPGAAVIAMQQGKTVYRNGFGMADLELAVRIEANMIFRIGSLTKQFTAVAVFILVEKGELSLNDKITRFFPESPVSWQKITVEHLLTHSSGLQSYTDTKPWEKLAKEDVKPEQIVELIKNEKLLFSPGDHLYYSNSGYFLLGVIIENVTGQKYGDFIHEQIFKHLGMNNSHFGSQSKIIPGRVKGYEVDDGTYQNAEYISMTSPFSAGGLLSSVDDLAVFNESLYSGRLISKSNVEKMTTPYKPNISGPPIVGYGCEIVSFKERRMVCLRGAINGFDSFTLHIPDDQIFVAILQNNVSTEFPSEYLAKKIAAILRGDPYPERQEIKLPNSILLKYAGIYRIDENNVRKIIVEEDRIFSQRNNGSKLEIMPSSETTFFMKGHFTYITFGFDDNGRVVNMIMHYEDGSQITAEKEK